MRTITTFFLVFFSLGNLPSFGPGVDICRPLEALTVQAPNGATEAIITPALAQKHAERSGDRAPGGPKSGHGMK